MTDQLDPNLAAENAVEKWGPDLLHVREHFENNFPGFVWAVAGKEPGPFEATIWTPEPGVVFKAENIDPVWALCLTLEAAAVAGHYQDVPPPPPPPPPPEAGGVA